MKIMVWCLVKCVRVRSWNSYQLSHVAVMNSQLTHLQIRKANTVIKNTKLILQIALQKFWSNKFYVLHIQLTPISLDEVCLSDTTVIPNVEVPRLFYGKIVLFISRHYYRTTLIFNKNFDFHKKNGLCQWNTNSSWYIYNIFLLTAIGLTPSGSSTVHIYTQIIHRTTQWNRIHRTFITIKIHKDNNKNT